MKRHTKKSWGSSHRGHFVYAQQTRKNVITLLLSAVFSASVTYAEEADTLTLRQDTVKSLYVSQQIDGAELLKVKDGSFANSLIGRMAGVTINPGASGVGGATRIIWRGYHSIMRPNNMLFTLDGVPLSRLNPAPTTSIDEGYGQTGDGIANLAPEDIESISVLNSAAASTLYGSSSAGGVVMIKTKKGHSGKLRAELSNSTMFSSPFVMPDFNDTHDPTGFFRTGHTINNSLTLSGGNAYNQTRFSAVTMNGAGIIPNNDVDRYSFSLRNTSSLLNNRLTLDLNLRYIHTDEQNMLSHGTYENPLNPIYLLPDLLQHRGNYEQGGPSIVVPREDWPYDYSRTSRQNPYWIINRDSFKRYKDRWIAGVGATFDITSWLNVAGRFNYDNDRERAPQERYRAVSTEEGDDMQSSRYENKVRDTQFYSDLQFNVCRKMGNFSLNATLGASIRDAKFDYSDEEDTDIPAYSADEYGGMEYSLLKTDYHDRTTSLFLLAQLAYKNSLSLNLGGRAEWFKIRSGNVSEASMSFYNLSMDGMYRHTYRLKPSPPTLESLSSDVFYPSAGISVTPTEWLPVSPHTFLSFLKFSYTYSETGNGLTDYVFSDKRKRTGSILAMPSNMEEGYDRADNLNPERTTSHEVSMNAGFLNNRVNLAFTMYKSSTSDLQIGSYVQRESIGGPFTVYEAYNGCRVDNKGFEAVLGTNMNLGQVQWNGRLIYSLNKNKIKKLMNPIRNSFVGQDITIKEFSMAGGSGWSLSLREGGSIGDLYVSDFVRDEQGKVVVDPSTQTVERAWEYVYAGNADPKYTMGLANSFAWKGFELDFVIHARIGGVGLSLTQPMMDRYNVSQARATARDNGSVWVDGTKIPVDNYYNTVLSYGVNSVYVYDATNVRLAEMSVAYHVPINKWVKWISGMRVAFIGRNLLMLYNKAPFDPESAASAGTWFQGIDNFRQPSYRNVGFSVSLTI